MTAICYPEKAAATATLVYCKLVGGGESTPKVKFDDNVDRFRSGETLMFEEVIILSEMVYEELLKRIQVKEVHLPDVMTICNEVVREVDLNN